MTDRQIGRDEAMHHYELAGREHPWCRVNFVTSIDGAATRDGVSGGLGTADDRVVFEALRTMADVVLVAAGTVRAEGYGGMSVDAAAVQWREARGILPQPRVAIVSRSLGVRPEDAVFTEAVTRPIVITCGASDAHRRAVLSNVADVLVCGESTVDLQAALTYLEGMGLRQVLCEGGPSLIGSMLEADLVDELCLTVSPVLEGGEAGRMSRSEAPVGRDMRLVHAIPSGDTALLRYVRADR